MHICVSAGYHDLFELIEILDPVNTRWRYIGLALRLDPAKLDEIEKENNELEDRLTKVLTLWLKKMYNTVKFGEPSWTLLAEAVGHPVGGKDSALAEQIRASKCTGIGFQMYMYLNTMISSYTCILLHMSSNVRESVYRPWQIMLQLHFNCASVGMLLYVSNKPA